MRIVGGSFRGRSLAAPPPGDRAIRPTSDRARESLFNILHSRWPDKLEGARVADLFSGTGAVGIEALSRGASFALFVEIAAGSRALIRKNIDVLQLQGCTRIFRRDATMLGPVGTMSPFDLVLLDPPYGKKLGEAALMGLRNGGWLSRNALCVLEEAQDAAFILPNGYELVLERMSGQSCLRFLTAMEEK